MQAMLRDKLDGVTDPMHPTEAFDLIAGTSTGALIAFGLAHGGSSQGGGTPMTVREIIQMYEEETENIFSRKVGAPKGRTGAFKAKIYNKKVLERDPVPYSQEGLEELLRTRFGNKTLRDFPSARCGAAAVARQFNQDPGQPDKLEMFETVRPPLSLSVVEVLKASACAPVFFDAPAKVGEQSYIDGGVGGNCPLAQAIPRMREINAGEGGKDVGVVLSIAPPMHKIREKKLEEFKKYEQFQYFLKYFPDMLTDGLQSYEATRKDFPDKKFFRLSPKSPETREFELDEVNVAKMLLAMKEETLDASMEYFEDLLPAAATVAAIHPSSSHVTDDQTLLIQSIATHAVARGNPSQARFLLEALLQKEGEEDTLLRARTIFCLGMAHGHEKNLEEAAELYEQALRMQERNSAPPTQVAATLHNLGCVCQEKSDFAKAVECLERSLRTSPNWEALFSLGNCCQMMNRLSDAVGHYEALLDMLGSEGDRTTRAAVLENLGCCCQKQKRFDQALTCLKRSLDLRSNLLRRDHPAVAALLSNIGDCYYWQGHYEEARAHHRKSLDMERAIHGKDSSHPTVAASVNSLAMCLEKLGQHQEALVGYEKSLELLGRTYGKTHPIIAEAHNNIAHCHKEAGNLPGAIQWYQSCLDLKKKNHSDPESVAATLRNLSLCQEVSREGDEAFLDPDE